MKSFVLLFASCFILTQATKDTACEKADAVNASQQSTAVLQQAPESDASVVNVLLNTIEFALSSQNVIAGI